MWVVDSGVCTLEQSRPAGEGSQGLRVGQGSRVGQSGGVGWGVGGVGVGVLCRSPEAFSAVLKSLFSSKDDREQGRGVSWVEHHKHICI